MKLKIKVKKYPWVSMPEIIKKGDWVDLKSRVTFNIHAPQSGTLKYKVLENGEKEGYRNVSFDYGFIPLGVAMKLPKGFEAIIVPRSSTFKKYGIIQANSMGIIDNSYCGNHDEWRFPAIALKDTTIIEGTRICQFRIQLSQKATIWQKIKWLLSSGIEFVEVEDLNSEDRDGFGSTGN